MSVLDCKYAVVGGGIAGVTCTETLSSLCPDDKILLITASELVKVVTNYQQLTKSLSTFDVEEKPMDILETGFRNVSVLQTSTLSLDSEFQVLNLADGRKVKYGKLCLCTGGRPKLIAENNPYIIGIRDTESVGDFQRHLGDARRIVVVGNGGIATELVYEIQNCEVIWAIKDKAIAHTFVDAGAGEFFLAELNEMKEKKEASPLKRRKYTVEGDQNPLHLSGIPGSALGPDWTDNLPMKGSLETPRMVHVEYQVELDKLLSPEDVRTQGLTVSQPWDFTSTAVGRTGMWPFYVQLTNGQVYGCDFVVSATGVVPNTAAFLENNAFIIAEDGGIKVNERMETAVHNVFAAGDVCTASWKPAPHWLQMRLWSQARQMGHYAAKCMVAADRNEDISLDFCFELFAHATKFFGYKVVLLGKFNGQDLGPGQELLLRVTKGKEYVKAILCDDRLHGAILVGETDLEETFENLILNQTDLSAFKEHLLDANIDIEDFFD